MNDYARKAEKVFDDFLDFHVQFERIHPFQDGKGRIGRLILFRELLRHDMISFLIKDVEKHFYYRGLTEWDYQKGYLRDTCLASQYRMETMIDYFLS